MKAIRFFFLFNLDTTKTIKSLYNMRGSYLVYIYKLCMPFRNVVYCISLIKASLENNLSHILTLYKSSRCRYGLYLYMFYIYM